jgi:hypothetical protein
LIRPAPTPPPPLPTPTPPPPARVTLPAPPPPPKPPTQPPILPPTPTPPKRGIDIKLVGRGAAQITVSDPTLTGKLITLQVLGKWCSTNFVARTIPHIKEWRDSPPGSPNAGWCLSPGSNVVIRVAGSYAGEVIL